MNNKHKLIKQLSKMTVNEMAFKLAEHKQALKDFKEKRLATGTAINCCWLCKD